MSEFMVRQWPKVGERQRVKRASCFPCQMKFCVVTFIGFVCRGELLSLRDIERLHKKPKSDKETRLATAKVRNWHVLCPVLLGLGLSCAGGNAEAADLRQVPSCHVGFQR